MHTLNLPPSNMLFWWNLLPCSKSSLNASMSCTLSDTLSPCIPGCGYSHWLLQVSNSQSLLREGATVSYASKTQTSHNLCLQILSLNISFWIQPCVILFDFEKLFLMKNSGLLFVVCLFKDLKPQSSMKPLKQWVCIAVCFCYDAEYWVVRVRKFSFMMWKLISPFPNDFGGTDGNSS